MLSIDKAINILKSDNYYNKSIGCDTSSEEQLIEWLEELKDYRDKNKMVVRVDVENMDSIKDKIKELSEYAESQYNKAIDDFKSRLEERILAGKMIDEKLAYIDNCDIDEIAEQLKAGGKNENA